MVLTNEYSGQNALGWIGTTSFPDWEMVIFTGKRAFLAYLGQACSKMSEMSVFGNGRKPQIRKKLTQTLMKLDKDIGNLILRENGHANMPEWKIAFLKGKVGLLDMDFWAQFMGFWAFFSGCTAGLSLGLRPALGQAGGRSVSPTFLRESLKRVVWGVARGYAQWSLRGGPP